MKKLGSPSSKSGKSIAPTAKSGKAIMSSRSFTIGRASFSKISEVEGIRLSGQMKKRIAGFESDGVSAAERRLVIIQAYRKS